MVPSYVIPLSYVSMALSVIALIVAVVLVTGLGKVGIRSYVVGLVTFISTYYVTDIIMTLLVMLGLGNASDTLFDFVKLVVSVAVQVSALRFFMHVFLKRHTYAVFYGAGVGFAIGNTFIELLSSVTDVSVATLMKEGSITAEYAEMYRPYMDALENMTLAEGIAGVIYPTVMIAVYVALAAVIGLAVRGENEYAYYAAGAWFAAGALLTLQDTFGLVGWTKLVTYLVYITIAAVISKWAKDKHGLSFELNKESDYHAPLSRRVEKKKK